MRTLVVFSSKSFSFNEYIDSGAICLIRMGNTIRHGEKSYHIDGIVWSPFDNRIDVGLSPIEEVKIDGPIGTPAPVSSISQDFKRQRERHPRV
jgi:hypothetical protein